MIDLAVHRYGENDTNTQICYSCFRFPLMIGQYTNWIYEMLHLFAQPTLEATLNDTFDLYDDTIPLVHLDHVGPNIATMVTSHLVVGLILSPLELVRTR